MMKRFCKITVLFLLAIFSFCQQAPAHSTKQYELGTTYQYDYNAAVLLNEPPPTLTGNSTRFKGADVGYQVNAKVEWSAVWINPSDPSHYVFHLMMKEPKLSIQSRKAHSPDGFADHTSPLDSLAGNSPVYVEWRDGKILYIHCDQAESPSIVNLKKGIAGLFQLQSTESQGTETDASGTCHVLYQQISERKFAKIKNNCKFEKPDSYSARPQKILGISIVSNSMIKYNFKEEEEILENLVSTEVHSLRVILRPQAGASVISRQQLHFTGDKKSNVKFSATSSKKVMELAAAKDGAKYVRDNLLVSDESTLSLNSLKITFKDAVAELRDSLMPKKLASSSAASAFISLLPLVQRSSAADISAVLKDKKNNGILPQLLDVIAAAQTTEGHAAVLEVIDFKKEAALDNAERYLQVLSLATYPSELLIRDVLKLTGKITQPKLRETALLTLAALTKTFVLNSKDPSDSVAVEIQTHLIEKLNACQKDECRQLYLRSLKNLGSPGTLETILRYVDNIDKRTSVAAMKALRALPDSVLDTEEVKDKLERVYFEIGRRYDSSARTLALDTLLELKPDAELVTTIFNVLASSNTSEINTYSLQRLQEFAGIDKSLESHMKHILNNNQRFQNYHVFSQSGFSTAFSRKMYNEPNSNGRFSSATEAAGSVMKRSSFDVYLSNTEDKFHLLSFGLFTGGLGSLVGSSGDETDEEDATAGMEITLSGVQLRPFIFFTGQGELMGHVWSGTASERTSALQATVLLQDHRQVIALQSGFFAILDLKGAVSFDFGGEVQVSLWNRNSHSVVENVAAWALDGSLTVVTPFVKSSVNFDVAAEAKIDFVTDVNFYDGLSLCLRMGQSEFQVNYTTDKRESIPGTKHWVHKRKFRQETVPGRSYVLNDKNSVLCNEMFASKS